MDLSLEFPTRYQNKTNSGGPSSPACHVTGVCQMSYSKNLPLLDPSHERAVKYF